MTTFMGIPITLDIGSGVSAVVAFAGMFVVYLIGRSQVRVTKTAAER